MPNNACKASSKIMIKLVDTKASDLLGGGEFLCSKTKSNYYNLQKDKFWCLVVVHFYIEKPKVLWYKMTSLSGGVNKVGIPKSTYKRAYMYDILYLCPLLITAYYY